MGICRPCIDAVKSSGDGNLDDFYHVNTNPGWLLGGMAARRNLANSEVVKIIQAGLLELGIQMYAGDDVDKLKKERVRLKAIESKRAAKPSDESIRTLTDRCIYSTVRFRLGLERVKDGGTIVTATALLARAMGKDDEEMLVWLKGKVSYEQWKEGRDL